MLVTAENRTTVLCLPARWHVSCVRCESDSKPNKWQRMNNNGETRMKKVLITGAGTGFGHEVAMRLAEKGFDVIAAVEIYAQKQTLKREAAARGVTLQVEKLDVTNEGDRKKALQWDIEILVNNAGVLEGGSV